MLRFKAQNGCWEAILLDLGGQCIYRTGYKKLGIQSTPNLFVQLSLFAFEVDTQNGQL